MADADPPFHLDKARVRQSFNRAAGGYDRVAVLQREVGLRLSERLDYVRLHPARLLDAGAGTGHVTSSLLRRYPAAQVVALDLALNMLQVARRRRGLMVRLRGRAGYVCGDAESLPLAPQSLDLIFSNLMLQWCNDLDRLFAEFRRVLRPGGLLLFSTFGPDTLQELRTSWRAADPYPHVHHFIDMHDIGDALMRAAYTDPVMDVERLTLTYPSVHHLMRELRELGAHNAAPDRPRGLTGRHRLHAVTAAYEAWRNQGSLPATFEVIYGTAWASAGLLSPREGNTVRIPVQALRRRGPAP